MRQIELVATHPKSFNVPGLSRNSLSRNGLRYPIPPYTINNDVQTGTSVNHG